MEARLKATLRDAEKSGNGVLSKLKRSAVRVRSIVLKRYGRRGLNFVVRVNLFLESL